MTDTRVVRYTLIDQFNDVRAMQIVPTSKEPVWPPVIREGMAMYGWTEHRSEEFWLDIEGGASSEPDGSVWQTVASALHQALVGAARYVSDPALTMQIEEALVAYSAETGWGDGSVQLPLDGATDDGPAPTSSRRSARPRVQRKRATADDAPKGKARKRTVVSPRRVDGAGGGAGGSPDS